MTPLLSHATPAAARDLPGTQDGTADSSGGVTPGLDATER